MAQSTVKKRKIRPTIFFIALYVLYLPFQTYLPGKILGITGLNVLNILVLVILFSWIVSEKMTLNKTGLDTPILLLFFIGLFSLFMSESEYFNYDLWTFKDSFAFILLYFAVVGSIRDADDARVVYFSILLVVALVVLSVFKELLGMPSTEHYHNWNRANGPFISGMGRGSNLVGAFMAQFSALFLAGYFYLSKKAAARAFFAFFAFLALYSLVYSYSRGGYAAALVALSFLLIIRGKKYFALFLVFIMFYPLWAPSSVIHRIEATREVTETGEVHLDMNAESRTAIWNGAIEMIKDHPLGVGFNNFRNTISDYVPTKKRMGATDAHNNYLLVTAELGIHGIMVYLWLMFTLLTSGWKLYRTSGDDSFITALSVGFLSALVALATANFFSSTFFIDQVNGIFWVLIATVMKMKFLKEKAKTMAGLAAVRTAA